MNDQEFHQIIQFTGCRLCRRPLHSRFVDEWVSAFRVSCWHGSACISFVLSQMLSFGVLEAKAGLSGIGVAGCQRLCTSAVGSRTSDVQTFLDVAGVAGRQASAYQVVLKLCVY